MANSKIAQKDPEKLPKGKPSPFVKDSQSPQDRGPAPSFIPPEFFANSLRPPVAVVIGVAAGFILIWVHVTFFAPQEYEPPIHLFAALFYFIGCSQRYRYGLKVQGKIPARTSRKSFAVAVILSFISYMGAFVVSGLLYLLLLYMLNKLPLTSANLLDKLSDISNFLMDKPAFAKQVGQSTFAPKPIILEPPGESQNPLTDIIAIVKYVAFYLGYYCTGVLNGLALVKLQSRLTPPPPEESRWSTFYRDTPLEQPGDDQLLFGGLAQSLRRFLDNKDTKPPLALAFNGPWGSGKSSLMRLVIEELNTTGRFHCVWFNAWRHGKEDSILAALLLAVSEHVSNKLGLLFNFRITYLRLKQLSIFTWYLYLYWFALAVCITIETEGSSNQIYLSTGAYLSFVLALASRLTDIWSKSKPFAQTIKQLMTPKDVSSHLAFACEFAQEFDMFQKALGHKKLLVAIDDLDRCPPEKVVHTLKAVNQILTGEHGNAKAFFLLGYDQDYVLHSIGCHYKDWLSNGENTAEFSRKYLKKMVTLAVSVPEANADGVENLTNKLGSKPESKQQIRNWLPRISFTTLARILVAAVMAAIIVWFFFPPESLQLNFNDIPDPEKHPFTFSAITLWIVTAAMLALAFASVPLMVRLLRKWSKKVERVKVTKQYMDTENLVTSVRSCKAVLPVNPRDLIRAVNAMRLNYRIQDPQSYPHNMTPYPGTELSEWESVTLSLLAYKYPDIFSRTMLSDVLIKHCGQHSQKATSSDIARYYTEYAAIQGISVSGLFQDIEALANSDEGKRYSIKHLLRQETLVRFLSVHKYALQTAPCPKNSCDSSR